ncbi:MAG: bis(5'-nucleosyl)-tetraphosphatase (symmetrical) YqeK [Limnochordia bacterium]|nr:bis(5'-nucleosyl)-tetraphosphatase (symmetrical) YqeK [Limnochordia bacterium]MDD2628552.1 bis(5'-nucleosyl)-tetraphosphatase (symmetrical) YqeK [Limnochordia bacterium]MDD4517691.1 bis(5'-nucleosyl)-tetraphosphatase (symmetrical) YqeK [Limnochordia bacterium]
MDIDELRGEVGKVLSAGRFRHTLGVTQTAAALAEQWEASGVEAVTAGLLHDYARELAGEQLLQIAIDFGILKLQIEESYPDLLHGPVAAILAREHFGITNDNVLNAIAYHTTGRAGMSKLEKIVYLADYIEPGRSFPGVKGIRRLAFVDLDRACLIALRRTCHYVLRRELPLHIATVEAVNDLLLSASS